MNGCFLGFNSERLDRISVTTHLGNGYRTYNPSLMYFNCPDSMSPFGAGAGITPMNWAQMGISAGIGATTALIGFGLGNLCKLKNISNQAVSHGKIVWGINERNINIIGDSHVAAPGGIGRDVNYFFEDNYRGTLRLNIYAHGACFEKLNPEFR